MSTTHTPTFPPLFARTTLKTRKINDYHQPIDLTNDQLAALLVVLLQPFGTFWRKENVANGYTRATMCGPFKVLVRNHDGLNFAISTTDDEGGILPLLLVRLSHDGISVRIVEHFHFDGVFNLTKVQGRCSRPLCLRMLEKAESYVRTFSPATQWTLSQQIAAPT